MNTPFMDTKATEISPDKQAGFFVQPPHMNRIINTKASFIFGERGSGKTTLLRHLEKVFNEDRNSGYIGIYYRFETARVKALSCPDFSTEQNIFAFQQMLSVVFCKLLCEILIKMKARGDLCLKDECTICKKMARRVELEWKGPVDSFENLYDLCEEVRRRLVINVQNSIYVCFLDFTTFFESFCEELLKEEQLAGVCFCMLLDEYENLTLSQQRVINSLVKNSSYYLTYKVCMRPDGFLTHDTVADREQLISPHDYEELDYVRDIVGDDSDVRKHLKKICERRFRVFYKQKGISTVKSDLDIEECLECIKDEETIESWPRVEEYKSDLRKDLIKYYPKREVFINELNTIDLKLATVLHEKKDSENEIFDNIINQSEKYKNWIHNYKMSICYQIAAECEQSKRYCGFSTLIKLANGNTRTLLEILHFAFGELPNDNRVYKKISVSKQTDAVKRVSKASFEQIGAIPVNGYKAKNLAYSLGNLFAKTILDKRLKKFESNNFSIKNTQIDDIQLKELKSVLRDAVMWGVLVPSTASKIKNLGDMVLDGRDFMLHPILSPYFKISYRKKQKCEFSDAEIMAMINDATSRSDINRIFKTVMEKQKWDLNEIDWGKVK